MTFTPMHKLSATPVFFVHDTPSALAFYTDTLGFSLDWTYEEQGRPYVVQVSLLGLEIILNQRETADDDRVGHGRLFAGLDPAQTAVFLQHVQGKGIPARYTHWGEPTMAIHDLDRNEIFIWLSDTERARSQASHSGTA